MAVVNVSSTYQADTVNYIQKKVMRLVQRQLVFYQFGDMLRLEKGRGFTYTGSRYDRLNLPLSPLSEGVPPVGEQMPLAQVQATAQQWGDKVTITDIAELTIYHDLFKLAIKLTAMQLKETLDRNTANGLLGGTQVNYVNSRGSRGAIVAGDVLNPHETKRAFSQLFTIGAPMYNGVKEEDEMKPADKPSKASANPAGMEHYVAIIHPFVEQDMRENPQVDNAWSFSDINRLYNNELGEWDGMRWCRSNLVPFWVGIASVAASPAGTGGALPAGTYRMVVTGSNAQNGYETQIAQVTTGIVVGGSGAGSVTLTTPSTAGYVWNVYIDTATSGSPLHLGTSSSGPTSGPYTGQAVQLPGNTSITITGVGLSQVPPAAPGTGITVYPTFIIGESAYGQVMLDDAQFFYLRDADKADTNNQLRVVAWKIMLGFMIENNQFFMRIESTSAFNSTFG